jgi:hypothetical protein
MRNITWYWNMIHYCVYLFFNNVFIWMNYLNPLTYVSEIPGVKRFYAKRGVNDMQGLTRTVANNPKSGINSIHAAGLMGGLIIILLFGLFDCSQLLFSISLDDLIFKNQTNDTLFISTLITLSLLFNYFTLFKGNKYLEYFREFDEMDATEKNKYYWISFIVVLLIVSFFIFSFRFTR